jgi:penicillin amidase
LVRVVKAVGVTVLVVVLVAVVVGVGAVTWITVRAWPTTDGELAVPGLDATATVARDGAGIAHITATTPHDLFLAQGYVHAQERMWQMEVWRHISAGRLSELFGESQLDTDRFIRTLGWRRAAERDIAAMAPAARTVLDAYAEGVNAWLDANRGDLGLSFVVSGADPAPWTALDSMAWGKVQAWNLGGNMDSEIFRYLADARLGDPARTDAMFPVRESAVITPTEGFEGDDEAGTVPSAPPSATALTTVEARAWRDVADLAKAPLWIAGLDAGAGLAGDRGIGSNNWVVAPTMSTTGGALLANDPHLGTSMPSIWFMNGLHCATVGAACPYDVAGVSFAGVPGVVLGHNARIAWGATNVDPDVQDLVIETVDPADPERYLTIDGSQPFTTRTEEIRLKGGGSETMTIRETIHGPILNDVDERLEGAPLMALRWTATHRDAAPDRTVEAVLGLNVAADIEDFRASLALYGAPSQNFVYADVDGHIGYQLPGYVPVRSDPADRGDRPVSGSDGTGEWVGRIPFEELPSQSDPEDGWIVTANNAAVDEGYPHFIGQEWDPGYRADRIIDLIANYGQDGLTVPEMTEIQMDAAPLRARDVVIAVDPAAPATDDGRTVAALISDWDGACVPASAGCAAYMAWEYRVLRDAFDDELGELARDYVGSAISWVALERLLEDPADPWWDDVTTTDVTETGDVIVARALDEAGAELRAALGDPVDWMWGRLHTATFREGTLGESGIGPLEWYFNHGPVDVGGAAGAADNTSYRISRAYPDPTDPAFVPQGLETLFTITNLPSYRLVIDMSDLDGARIVITTGQSGNPFDGHYGDLVDPWRTGGTVPLPFTRAAIEAATVATLTLSPAEAAP